MFAKLASLRISSLVIFKDGVVLLGVAVIAFVFMQTLDSVKIGGPIYNDLKENADITADILPPPMYLIETYLSLKEVADCHDKACVKTWSDNYTKTKKEFEDRAAYWAKQSLSPEVTAALKEVEDTADTMFHMAEKKVLSAAEGGNGADAAPAMEIVSGLYQDQRVAVDKLVKICAAESQVLGVRAEQAITKGVSAVYLAIGIVLVVILLLAAVLIGVARRLASVTKVLSRLAEGNSDIKVILMSGNGEIPTLWRTISSLCDVVGEAFKLRAMIDQMPLAVMSAEPKTGVITYANQETLKIITGLEKHLPVKADHLVGSNIGVFHKNPAHQQKIIEDGSKLPMTAKISLGGEIFSLQVDPIKDKGGKYILPMVTWRNITKREKLVSDFEGTVLPVAKEVGDFSERMSALAQGMGDNANRATELSTQVATAATQMNANVETVASAAEELTASVSEISRQVDQASKLVADATTKTDVANTKISELSVTTGRIDEAATLINAIAAQTNLLALNATIEAARAGEAGKGFAVVASEVKALASQTSKATEEIVGAIASIKEKTKETVDAVKLINEMMRQVGENTFSAAKAVKEQGEATHEISRNVQEAAQTSREVSQAISSVASAASDTGTAASEVLGSSNKLSEKSVELKANIDKFLENIR